jgi:hypothetical protein
VDRPPTTGPRNAKLVFKEGAAYDPAKLLDSVRGQAGVR